MARSRKGRARQAARRDAYAAPILDRVVRRTNVSHMVWNDELAVALPNHLTVDERAKYARLFAGLGKVELAVRFERLHEEYVAWLHDHEGVTDAEFVPSDKDVWALWRAHSRQEHVSGNGGKIVQPTAGLKGPQTRLDTSIAPSWEPLAR